MVGQYKVLYHTSLLLLPVYVTIRSRTSRESSLIKTPGHLAALPIVMHLTNGMDSSTSSEAGMRSGDIRLYVPLEAEIRAVQELCGHRTGRDTKWGVQAGWLLS
jgi:hypothetical protein